MVFNKELSAARQAGAGALASRNGGSRKLWGDQLHAFRMRLHFLVS